MLYVVATPIGNLGDITLRALEVLKSVDLVAAEDTRHSGLLMKHFGIKKPFISYHEHNEAKRTAEFVERLAGGENIALITDAGTLDCPIRDCVLFENAFSGSFHSPSFQGHHRSWPLSLGPGFRLRNFLSADFFPLKLDDARASCEPLLNRVKQSSSSSRLID